MATGGASSIGPQGESSTESERPSGDESLVSKLTVPMLRATEQQLLDNLSTHEAVLEAAKLPLPAEDDTDKLKENIITLQTELHSLVTDLAQREIIMKRLQLSQMLMDTLYPPEGVSEQEDQSDREELKAMILQQCELVSKILDEYKEIQEMKPKLEEAMTKKFEYTNENRKLMSILKERQEAQTDKSNKFTENADIQEAQERVQKLIWRTELQRNTLQGLILGSGVNWAQDEELQEMLLSLGKPLHL